MNNQTIIVRQGDILKFAGDAIVNPANRWLIPGGGLCAQIFKAAGPDRLTAHCVRLIQQLGRDLEWGENAVTPGFNLSAKHIIHAVGPDTREEAIREAANENDLLIRCYRNILESCIGAGIRSVAIPAISTGIYRFPLDRATEIAVHEVTHWLDANDHIDLSVTFVAFDEPMFDMYNAFMAGNAERPKHSPYN